MAVSSTDFDGLSVLEVRSLASRCDLRNFHNNTEAQGYLIQPIGVLVNLVRFICCAREDENLVSVITDVYSREKAYIDCFLEVVDQEENGKLSENAIRVHEFFGAFDSARWRTINSLPDISDNARHGQYSRIALNSDIRFLRGGGTKDDLLKRPLWPEGVPDEVEMEIEEMRTTLARSPASGFWLRWYQSVLDGASQNWEMLRDIALIDLDDWEKGLDRVAERIAEIEARYAQTPVDPAIYRDQIDRLLTYAASTALAASTAADMLDAILAAWREDSGNAPPDELLTMAKVPPVLRRIASVAASAEADRVEILKAELDALRGLVLQLRADVSERERRLSELSVANAALMTANARVVTANAELTEQVAKATHRSTRVFLFGAVAGGFAGGMGQAAFGELCGIASLLLGPLLDGSVLDSLAQQAPNAPVSAPTPPETLDI